MNEFLRQFVMITIRKMIESNSTAEWQVREYALGWYSKGVLAEADLKEIDDMYKQPEPEEETIEEEAVEETSESGGE